MAEDGTSALTAVSRTAFVPDTGATPRVFGAPSPEARTSTSITAEIPAVPAGPSYGVLLPDGTVWYPGSQKRLPAPLLLRVVVWILALATVLAAAGAFVIRYHPSWANPFRRIVASSRASRAPAGGGAVPHATSLGGGSSLPAASSVGPLSPQPSGLPAQTTAYRAPSGSYTVQVSEAAGHDAWVAAFPITNGQVGTVFKQQVIFGGQSFTVNATAEFQLEVAALGATIQVLQNGKIVGTVATPPHVPWNWRFEPPAAAGPGH